MHRTRPLLALVGVLLTGAALCPGAGAQLAREVGSAHGKDKPRSRSHHSSKKARERHRLQVLIRRNPKALLKPSFIHAAQVADFALPITVRLNEAIDSTPTYAPSDDTLTLAWDTSTTASHAWPMPPDLLAGVSWAPAAPQTVTLTGGFAMEMHFGTDTSGYGGLGALETTQGYSDPVTHAPLMHGTPFAISDFDPVCADGPALRVASGTTVAFRSAGVTYGMVNLASQTAAGVLHLYADLNAERADSCAGGGGTTWFATGEDASTATPIVLTYSGTFKISPAITADGRLRLAKLSVDALTAPQQSSFSYLYACASAPTPSEPCNNEEAFPARVAVQRLTGELLVGSAPVG